ncbi:hypothetical protein AYI68_g2603 [Smittium mucronatum]|uniref:Uncharacterized protein n=1 Tax=Smittium mucronatum TaxID=133383 RepID=A0A1R0H2A7_9FUNG|nr:hypothetical protein AYI68_g2603 [Smittium mucronatum]
MCQVLYGPKKKHNSFTPVITLVPNSVIAPDTTLFAEKKDFETFLPYAKVIKIKKLIISSYHEKFGKKHIPA